VDFEDGICYFLWDRDHAGKCEVTTVTGEETSGPLVRGFAQGGADHAQCEAARRRTAQDGRRMMTKSNRKNGREKSGGAFWPCRFHSGAGAGQCGPGGEHADGAGLLVDRARDRREITGRRRSGDLGQEDRRSAFGAVDGALREGVFGAEFAEFQAILSGFSGKVSDSLPTGEGIIFNFRNSLPTGDGIGPSRKKLPAG